MNDYPPITDILPHRPPMLLLDEILAADEDSARARASITPDHVLYDARLGGVPVWAGIELMAQTCGCWAGYLSWRRNRPPKHGYLLSTRRYTGHVPVLENGAELEVVARLLYLDDGGLGSFECHISENGRRLAEARLGVYQANELSKGNDE